MERCCGQWTDLKALLCTVLLLWSGGGGGGDVRRGGGRVVGLIWVSVGEQDRMESSSFFFATTYVPDVPQKLLYALATLHTA